MDCFFKISDAIHYTFPGEPCSSPIPLSRGVDEEEGETSLKVNPFESMNLNGRNWIDAYNFESAMIFDQIASTCQ